MNEKRKNIFSEILCGKWFPLLLLVVMALTYAVQLPKLGYYIDDWVYVASYDQGWEAGLIAYGIDDSRPFALLMTAKFFSLLGTGILRWQLITLFWRFCAGCASCWLLRKVWPQQKTAAGVISLLFGVFPYFKHQAACIAYFNVLMQYFVILLSFCLTVQALQTEKKWLKTLCFLLSYATSAYQLACLEYYLPLEAARLLLIYFILSKRDGAPFKKTARRALLIYIPYLLLLAAALAYRFLYIPTVSTDVRPITLFTKYKGLNILFHLLSLLLQYLSESFLGVWYRSLNPAELDLTTRNAQLGLGLGLLGAAIVFFLLKKSREPNEEQRGAYEMLLFGFCTMLLGYLPGMMLDVSPSSTGAYHDRFLIPAFWGISIFTVSWVGIIFRNRSLRYALYGGMICLCVFFQIQNSFMYRYSWKYQQQFQWSMKWRVPDLEENTAVFSDGVVASFMGGWADSSMLFEMYGKHEGLTPTPYWYFNVAEKNYLPALEAGDPIVVDSKMYRFETDAENVLLITKPEYGKCAWVLDEADSENPYLESGIEAYIPYQNKSRIRMVSDYEMPAEIFGTDYLHDWCYYFENADLAFDRGEYERVLSLYDELSDAGLSMGNPTEMRPFIKAAAFTGDWEKALAWSDEADAKSSGKTAAYFANLWKLIERDAPESEGKAEAVSRAAERFADGE